MRKIFYLLVSLLCMWHFATATNTDGQKKRANAPIYNHIDGVYGQIKYQRGMKRLKKETFRSAYYGYLNLLEHNKLRNKRYLTVCDFSLSSNSKRLWLIDTRTKRVVINTLVAHGQGTGEEYARRFSNIPESHQSSLGFFVTTQTYSGKNGYSMRMNGVDGSWNNKALSRDIVMHGADYVSTAYARANKRLGRSWGCPAVAQNMAAPIIDKIKNGSCLFIYHPTKSYLRSSFWLNDRIARLPSGTRNQQTAQIAVKDNFQEGVTESEKPAMSMEEAEEDTGESLLTIVEYEDPQEVKDLKNDKNVKVQTITIPEDQVTPEMRRKALKKKKIVRKISQIIHRGKKDKQDAAVSK